MVITQISAFIENKPGRLAEVIGFLAQEDINIHALSIADTTDFGILRLIVSNPQKTWEILKERGLTVKLTDVIAVALEHRPGSLARVLGELESKDISIEYMYAFTSRSSSHDAMVIFRLDRQQEALEKIKGCSIELISSEILSELG
ncbi:MAG: hypothetical protein LBU32_20000 [Clostridiales bacterium]|jgi:hypothetical protein|nr:hypothetical protein [Clostridiales bacterium]